MTEQNKKTSSKSDGLSFLMKCGGCWLALVASVAIGKYTAQKNIEAQEAKIRAKNTEVGVVRGWEDDALYVSALPSVTINRKLVFPRPLGIDSRDKSYAVFKKANVGDTIRYLNPNHEIDLFCRWDPSPEHDRSVISLNGIPADTIYARWMEIRRLQQIDELHRDFINSLSKKR